MADSRTSTRSSRKQLPVVYPEDLEDLYAMKVAGNCMAPEIPEGSAVLGDKLSPIRRGDLVIVFMRRDLVRPGQFPGRLKRLALDLPRRLKFPFLQDPQSTVEPCICLQQLNPNGRFFVPASHVEAIHRCLGVVEIQRGMASVSNEMIERAREGGDNQNNRNAAAQRVAS